MEKPVHRLLEHRFERRSIVLAGFRDRTSVREEQMDLSPERRLTAAVLGDQIVQYGVACSLIEPLRDQHLDHALLEELHLMRGSLCHPPHNPEERGARHIVPTRTPRLGILLPLILLVGALPCQPLFVRPPRHSAL